MLNSVGGRTGGQILADALRIHGVDHVFLVPGESCIALLDALYDHQAEIKVVNSRCEISAANMAEAYGKLTGRPGVAIVARGPGACHASVGVHTAYQDSTPMILLVGQVMRGKVGREAVQELDYRLLFSQTAKWVTQIDDATRIPEVMTHAFHLATSGRPGPVVVALPKDMLSDRREVEDAPRYQPIRPHPGHGQLKELRLRLASARRPILLLGGSGWSDEARDAIRAFSVAGNLPTCSAYRRQDIFDTSLPTYIGDLSPDTDPRLVQRVKDADLLLAVGTRLDELTTMGYSVMTIPVPRQALVHVHPDANEIGRVFQPVLGIQSGMPEFASALAALSPIDGSRWSGWTEAARADRVANTRPAPESGELNIGQCMRLLSDRAEEDAIYTCDGGNFSSWISRYIEFRGRQRHLGPISGAMGYGVPAAVCAKVVRPDRRVIAFVGDGGFMMTGQEIVTAFDHGVAPLVIVFNNGIYGTIRLHQERDYPGRTIGTTLHNPPFAKLMQVYGGWGEAVERTDDFGPALERALGSGKPALIELRTDPNQLTTRMTIDRLRQSGS